MSELLQQSDQQGQLDWQAHYVDGTVIRAHQHAAGAAGTPAEEQTLGRSQGGFSTKVHLKAEGQGQPLHVVLTPGQQLFLFQSNRAKKTIDWIFRFLFSTRGSLSR